MPIHLYSSDYNLGKTSFTGGDGGAFAAMVTDATTLFRETGLTRTNAQSIGVICEISAGTFVMEDTATPTPNLVRQIINNPTHGGRGGDLIFQGQGEGITVLSSVGHDVGAGSFQIASVMPTMGTTTMTVGTTASHGMVRGDPFAIELPTRGQQVWCHFTVVTRVDATHFTYNHGTYADERPSPTVGRYVEALGWLFEPLGFSVAQRCIFKDLTFMGNGSGVTTPLSLQSLPPTAHPAQVGFGLRRTSRVETIRCGFVNWWAADVVNGSIHPNASSTAQDTDHTKAVMCDYQGNHDSVLVLTNDGADVGANHVGNSRDNVWRDCNMGASQRSHFAVADDGSLQNFGDGVFHGKSAPYPIYGEGVEGVTPATLLGIDIASGTWKFESPGNSAFFFDESRERTVTKVANFYLEQRATVNINGLGSPNDQTDKYWAVTALSMAVSPSIMQFTLPSGHGLRKGDHVAVGVLPRSNAISVMDGATAAPNIVTAPSANFSAADIKRQITIGGATYTIASYNSGTGGVTVNGSPFSGSASGLSWSIGFNGGIFDQCGIVSNVSGSVIQMLRPDYLPMAGSVAPIANPVGQIAGLVVGWRFGLLDGSLIQVLLDQDSSDALSSANLHYDLKQVNASTIVALQGNVLPAFQIEGNGSPGKPLRTVVSHGENIYALRFHDASDGNAIVAGNLVELASDTWGNLTCKRSTGVKTKAFGGIAMSGSPALGAITVTAIGTGASATVVANRQELLVAVPIAGVALTSGLDGDPTNVQVTGTPVSAATILVDNGDGTAAAWNGSATGKRVVGQSASASSGSGCDAELAAPYWT